MIYLSFSLIDMKKIRIRADRPLLLLPNYFKTIGVVSVITLIIVLALIKSFPDLISSMNLQYVRPWLKSLLMFSLFVIAVSLEKKEDERIAHLRARILAGSFSIAILVAILIPIAKLLGDNVLSNLDVYEFMLMQLVFYHGTFASAKRYAS